MAAHGMHRSVGILFSALLVLAPARAQASFSWIASEGNSSFSLFPCVKAGSHDLSCGLSATGMGYFNMGFVELGLGAFASGKAFAVSPGLDEKGIQAALGLETLIAAGQGIAAPSPWPELKVRSSLSIRLAWRQYFDGWGTSQALGSLGLAYSTDDWSLGFLYYNDFFAFLNKDEYRTAAGEIAFAFRAWEKDCVIAAGLKLWTGAAIGNLKRGEFYDMSLSPVGSDRSAGILYGGFRIDFLGVELGWDAESIRNFFQNGLHALMDDGSVPLVDRPDRLYVAVTLYRDGDLY